MLKEKYIGLIIEAYTETNAIQNTLENTFRKYITLELKQVFLIDCAISVNWGSFSQ